MKGGAYILRALIQYEDDTSSQNNYDAEDEKVINIIRSKVMVIDNISLTVNRNIDEEITLKVDSRFYPVSDGIIPKVDIISKEDIIFDETLTVDTLKKIIRRCGILEQYEKYYINDPEIVINSYTLNIKSDYKFFEEFRNAAVIVESIC
jgi:hypothetical protein